MNKAVLENICKNYCVAHKNLELNNIEECENIVLHLNETIKVVEELEDLRFEFKSKNGLLTAKFFDKNTEVISEGELFVDVDIDDSLFNVFGRHFMKDDNPLSWVTEEYLQSKNIVHSIIATYSGTDIELHDSRDLSLNLKEESGLRKLFLFYGYDSEIQLIVDRYSLNIVALQITDKIRR